MPRSSGAVLASCVAALAACSGGAPASNGGAAGAAGGVGAGPIGMAGAAGGAVTAAAAGSSAGGASSGGAAGAAVSAGGSAGASGAVGSGGVPANSAGAAGTAGAGGTTPGTSGAAGGGGASAGPKRVLLYHFSTLVIDSVPLQLTLLQQKLETWGYEVVISEDPASIAANELARFAAVAMINTCFEPFGADKNGMAEAAVLKAFVEAGGGLFGTHCASVTFQSAEPPHPYNAVIGGRGGHGFFDGASQCRTVAAHPTTEGLAASFTFDGNLDNADFVAPDATVLVKCKWSGSDLKDVAVSWYRTPGKGRVFYTNFAKEARDLEDASLGAQHILIGLGWVLGR